MSWMSSAHPGGPGLGRGFRNLKLNGSLCRAVFFLVSLPMTYLSLTSPFCKYTFLIFFTSGTAEMELLSDWPRPVKQREIGKVVHLCASWISHMALVSKNWPANAGVSEISWRRTAYSSTVAWRIPWTEEPARLQSIGSHRLGHDWSNKGILDITAPQLGIVPPVNSALDRCTGISSYRHLACYTPTPLLRSPTLPKMLSFPVCWPKFSILLKFHGAQDDFPNYFIFVNPSISEFYVLSAFM